MFKVDQKIVIRNDHPYTPNRVGYFQYLVGNDIIVLANAPRTSSKASPFEKIMGSHRVMFPVKVEDIKIALN